MARKARICVPGAIHHITAHVIRGEKLYRDDLDKQKFLDCLHCYLSITGFILYSIEFYPTHYHMVVRINHLPLEKLYRGLHSVYAKYYNKKYGLSGYFFQDRPRSVAVEDGDETQELMRYTNTGPIRAGFCKSLQDLDIYPGTHSAILGFHQLPYLKTEDILSIFGDKTTADPKAYYHDFIRQGIENARGNLDFLKLVKGANKQKEDMYEPGYWVIGSKKFIQDAINLDKLKSVHIARHKVAGWGQDELSEFIVSITSVSLADLRKRSRNDSKSEARKLYCYFATEVLDMPKTSTGNHLGISRTAVVRLAKLGKIIAEKRQLELPVI